MFPTDLVVCTIPDSSTGGARSAWPLPEPAVLDPVAAGGHVAPGADLAVGAVVERPPAVRVAACLQPRPGPVPLRVADHQQQGEQARVGVCGGIDVVDNICYVAATRTGAFGLAVVLASLYPGFTVLLARVVLGERLRWVQRAGLALAAIGILLVTV
jgi:EamA-like transporter family